MRQNSGETIWPLSETHSPPVVRHVCVFEKNVPPLARQLAFPCFGVCPDGLPANAGIASTKLMTRTARTVMKRFIRSLSLSHVVPDSPPKGDPWPWDIP